MLKATYHSTSVVVVAKPILNGLAERAAMILSTILKTRENGLNNVRSRLCGFALAGMIK